jgi:molybdenum cofactor biosynthesis enzyme MoaA
MKFCCEASPPEEFDLTKHTIKDLFNSEYYNKIRRDHLAGIKNKECNACWKKEEAGLLSKRLQEYNIFDEDENVRKNFKLWKSGNDIMPTYYNLQVSKTCNQACLMCTPFYSSLLESIIKDTETLDRWKSVPYKGLDKNKTFWEGLYNISDSLERLYITGGEPFLIKELWKYIEHIVDTGVSKNITFWCSTNFNYVTKNQLDLLKEFNSVEINCSIDTFGKSIEYQRYGSSWETIQSNIDLVRPYLNNNFKLQLVPVVHALSIKDFDKLVLWWKNTVNSTIMPNLLVSPLSMHISSVRKEVFNHIVNIIEQERHMFDSSQIENVLNAIDSHEYNVEHNKLLYKELTYYSQVTNKDCLTEYQYLFDK